MIDWASPIACSVAAFGGFALSPNVNTLDYSVLFTSLATLQIMIMPLFVVLGSVPDMIEAYVSYRRVREYLAVPASTIADSSNNLSAPEKPTHPMPGNQLVLMEDVSAGWKEDSIDISNVSLTLNKGDTVVISGSTGSGKSTILKTALGETIVKSGTFRLASNKVSFVDQTMWFVPNCTIKDNIQFGKEDDVKLYQEVLHCCCLDYDMRALPAGDQTMLDETATSLSGGQRRRVAIARALYNQADIFLLDDIFNGLDARTRQTIARNLVGSNGFFRQRNAAVLISSAEALDFLYSFENVTSLHLSPEGLRPIENKVTDCASEEKTADIEEAEEPLPALETKEAEASTPIEDGKTSLKDSPAIEPAKQKPKKKRKSPHLFFIGAMGVFSVAFHAFCRCAAIAAEKASCK